MADEQACKICNGTGMTPFAPVKYEGPGHFGFTLAREDCPVCRPKVEAPATQEAREQ